MWVYDGRDDKRAPLTNHTVAVVSADRISCGVHDSMTIRKNGRADWSLFYCEAGCLYFEDKILKAGQIWIYPPQVPQKYTMYSRENTVYRYLHFTGSDVAFMMEALGIGLLSAINVRSSSIVEIFDQIQNSLKDDGALSALQAEYHTLHLISLIARTQAQPSPVHMMKRITDSMEHSFAMDYDDAGYADMLGMSVSRFHHLFKECVGMSPYAYYLRVRIANACSLLEETDLKVKDIAEKCGYRDALYFTQAFKKETGITPSAYRKTRRK